MINKYFRQHGIMEMEMVYMDFPKAIFRNSLCALFQSQHSLWVFPKGISNNKKNKDACNSIINFSIHMTGHNSVHFLSSWHYTTTFKIMAINSYFNRGLRNFL